MNPINPSEKAPGVGFEPGLVEEIQVWGCLNSWLLNPGDYPSSRCTNDSSFCGEFGLCPATRHLLDREEKTLAEYSKNGGC